MQEYDQETIEREHIELVDCWSFCIIVIAIFTIALGTAWLILGMFD